MKMEETKGLISEILNLYDESLEKIDHFHKKLELFVVPIEIANFVMSKLNLDIENHIVTIDNFGILHSLEEHGNPITEAKRGQISIEKNDFVKIIDVLLYPDEINFIGLTKHTKLPLLQFIKEIENKIYIVKEVRTITSQKKKKVSRLVFHTMYKIKATKIT
jgi:hypothetical protein